MGQFFLPALILFCVGVGCFLIGIDLGDRWARKRSRIIPLKAPLTEGLVWIGGTIASIAILTAVIIAVYPAEEMMERAERIRTTTTVEQTGR